MSSMAYAAMRSESSMVMPVPWSTTGVTVIPKFFVLLSETISLRFEEPEVEDTLLPRRSAKELMLALFLLISRVAVTKVVGLNETCCWRSTLFVVFPHSRSIVPLAIRGMRVAEATGCSFAATGTPRRLLVACTIFIHRSM